jgi:hypothetical protein
MERTQRSPTVNAEIYLEQARDWTCFLEDKEARSAGLSVNEVRPLVADRIKVPAGTLKNIRKRRLKAIAVHWYERLRAGVVNELHEELRQLTHEIHVLTATGTHPASSEMEAAQADLARVRKALGLPPNGGAL